MDGPSFPPVYTPSSVSPPDYAPEPSGEEQRLAFIPRHARRRIHTLTKAFGKVSVAFNDQESSDDSSVPSYTRGALVSGEISVHDEKVLAVCAKLEGTMYLSVTEDGDSAISLFSETCPLWSRHDTADNSLALPLKVPFHIPLPSNYKDGSSGNTRPLPPTYSAHFPGLPGLYARCAYNLTVVVTTPRLGSWKRHKTITIPIRHHPRTRPYLPISPSLHPLFSSVKMAPGEWHQVTSTMRARETPNGPTVQPLDCHLFIPAAQIYALSDTIPFHLQLRGSPSSLRAFLHPPQPARPSPTGSYLSLGAALACKQKQLQRTVSRSTSMWSISSGSTWSSSTPTSIMSSPPPLRPFITCTRTRSISLSSISSSSETMSSEAHPLPSYADGSPCSRHSSTISSTESVAKDRGTASAAGPSVRVFLLRQVAVTLHGQKVWRESILGEGVVRALPPTGGLNHSHSNHDREDGSEASLDWEGEVQCRTGVDVGGFSAGPLVVKDFLVLALKPPSTGAKGLLSPLMELQHAHPVRLVTDSYQEVYSHEQEEW